MASLSGSGGLLAKGKDDDDGGEEEGGGGRSESGQWRRGRSTAEEEDGPEAPDFSAEAAPSEASKADDTSSPFAEEDRFE